MKLIFDIQYPYHIRHFQGDSRTDIGGPRNALHQGGALKKYLHSLVPHLPKKKSINTDIISNSRIFKKNVL